MGLQPSPLGVWGRLLLEVTVGDPTLAPLTYTIPLPFPPAWGDCVKGVIRVNPMALSLVWSPRSAPHLTLAAGVCDPDGFVVFLC